jgi:hypothetical protein
MTTRLLIAVTVVCVLFAAAAHAATDKSAASKGAAWLLKGKPSGDGQGADTVVALRAAGKLSGSQAKTRAAVVRSGAAGYAVTAGAAGKTILALVASGTGNPRCAGKLDLYKRVTGSGANGRYGHTAWDQALGMIALRSLGAKPPRSTADFLLSTRAKGGWNFTLSKTAPDDVTHTALAIMALRAAGVKKSNRGLKAGIKWMLTQRSPAGGFAHQRKDRNEANATALALEALRSAGRHDKRAAKALRALQRSDGAFQFTATDSGSRGLATVDAVVALAGKQVPVARRAKLPAAC